jgi:hypothetical protein
MQTAPKRLIATLAAPKNSNYSTEALHQHHVNQLIQFAKTAEVSRCLLADFFSGICRYKSAATRRTRGSQTGKSKTFPALPADHVAQSAIAAQD